MAKFYYRMQNILDIKYKLEEQAKQEFAQVQTRYRQEQQKLFDIQKRREQYLNEMRSRASDRLDVRELERCNQAIEILDEQIRVQKEQVFRAMAEVDKAREYLNDVMQERKTHEKLKEHQFEQFMKDLNAQEMKEIDELVSYQHSVPKEGE
ncbi:MAG: flagellar export protein FliJ [Clostridium sp.]|nr:flagellar export protein FliJ [Clostridium sp.]